MWVLTIETPVSSMVSKPASGSPRPDRGIETPVRFMVSKPISPVQAFPDLIETPVRFMVSKPQSLQLYVQTRLRPLLDSIRLDLCYKQEVQFLVYRRFVTLLRPHIYAKSEF